MKPDPVWLQAELFGVAAAMTIAAAILQHGNPRLDNEHAIAQTKELLTLASLALDITPQAMKKGVR